APGCARRAYPPSIGSEQLPADRPAGEIRGVDIHVEIGRAVAQLGHERAVDGDTAARGAGIAGGGRGERNDDAAIHPGDAPVDVGAVRRLQAVDDDAEAKPGLAVEGY